MMLINFVLIVYGSVLSKIIFLLGNFRRRSWGRFLVAGEGFVFAVEIYNFFSGTASTAVSDTTMSSLFFYCETGKCSQ